VVSPRLLFAFGSAVQVAYYGLLLTAFAALVAATTWFDGRRPRLSAGLGASMVAGLLVLGRQGYGETVALGTVVALGVVAVSGVAAGRLTQATAGVAASPAPQDD
jgi:hypothetical protein